LQKGITAKSQMTSTRETNYSVVLDACVLVPVSLCDLLLRLAEEPSMYRPVWSEQILTEMTRALRTKLHRTPAEAAWRRQEMVAAFPEAMVTFAAGLLRVADCVPDRDDRHVLAVAIAARADTIVTQISGISPRVACNNLVCAVKPRIISSSSSITAIRSLSSTNLTIRQRELQKIADTSSPA